MNVYLDKNKNTNLKIEENKFDGFFEKRKNFFTKSERIFFSLLSKENNDENIILSKVRLEDIVQVVKNAPFGKRNYIKSKHIDFVIVEKNSGEIILAIELDGKSHNSERQKKYDDIKNQILNSVNIPLHRVRVGEKFEERIKEILNNIEKKEITN